MEDLLSYLFYNRAGKKEDVAADVLSLLLSEPPGQAFLRSCLNAASSTTFVLRKRRQCCYEKDGVSYSCNPDIQVLDSDKTVGIIELKFDAGLTEAQKSNAYSLVANDVIFIVPNTRHREVQVSFDRFHNPPNVLTWDNVLKELADRDPPEMTEPLYRIALDQLRSFCKVLEFERFAPFTPTTVAQPPEGKTFAHCKWLVKEVKVKAVAEKLVSDDKEAAFGGNDLPFFGFNARIGGVACWIGYWPKAWQNNAASGPLWLVFEGKIAAQARTNGLFENGTRVEANELAIPLLRARQSMAGSHDEEVDFVLSELKSISQKISVLNC